MSTYLTPAAGKEFETPFKREIFFNEREENQLKGFQAREAPPMDLSEILCAGPEFIVR